jgi:GrpB-like predicted nucleotidyltransferase (UPF0157 family)
MNVLKKILHFKNEIEEREFWLTHDSTDYLDWSKSKKMSFPHLKTSTVVKKQKIPPSTKLPSNLDEEITLKPFNPQWSKIYQTEALRLRKKVGGKFVAVEHIGSTAILAIHAKPIIDIMIGVENLTEIEPIIKSLQELGYEYCGEANVPERLYFRIRNKNGQSFNLAVCQY